MSKLKLVSFELAKKLNLAGFDWDTPLTIELSSSEPTIDNSYDYTGNAYFKLADVEVARNDGLEVYLCPTLELARQWFRDLYNTEISIDFYFESVKLGEVGYIGTVCSGSVVEQTEDDDLFETYEEALEDALMVAYSITFEKNL